MTSPPPPTGAAEFEAGAQAALERFKAGAQRVRQQAEQAKSAIERADAEVSDGPVTVDVSPDGRIRSLRLRDDVGRLDGDRLADVIVRTVHRGTLDALRDARRGVAEAFGGDNEATEVLDEQIAARTPPTQPATGTPSSEPAPDIARPSAPTPNHRAVNNDDVNNDDVNNDDVDDDIDDGPRDGRGL